MSNLIDLELENKSKELLAVAKSWEIQPNPYLKHVVLARLKNHKRKNWVLPFAFAALALMIMAGVLFDTTGYSAQTQTPILVKVDVQKEILAAHVHILLPPGVHFYSKNHPELNSEDQLKLRWQKKLGRTDFPIVIMANESGSKKILIRFLDENFQLASEKTIAILFKDKT